MIGIWEFVGLIVALFALVILYTRHKYSHFNKHGIKNHEPKIPFGGNLMPIYLKKVNFFENMQNLYKDFPSEKYIGYYEILNKLVIIRDIELIKKITVKDFDHFVNHRPLIPDDIDPLFGGHLVVLQDQKWKDMRNTLSPAFTGSKMRIMFSLIEKYTNQFVDYYRKKVEDDGGQLEVELKNMYGIYTTDVIATCAFGIEPNTLEEPMNPFHVISQKMSKFRLKAFISFIMASTVPWLMRALKLKIMSESDLQFFRDLVLGSMKERQEKGIVRPDMINLLMELKKGSLKYEENDHLDDAGFATVQESELGKRNVKTKFTDDNLVAQVFIFLVAGFDTASNLLSFLSYELAINPDIQRKLRDEVDDIRKSLDGELTYNDLQKMKYLDMVVSETLRYWPPGSVTDRMCSKPYELPPPNDSGKPYPLEVGDVILIPILGIHHDPQYYENPEKFDPERFSDENKHKIQPYTYLPFGLGPRNCIGSRFALMEIKAIMFHMISHFEFVATEKTKIPLKLEKGSVRMAPEGGFMVGLKSRK